MIDQAGVRKSEWLGLRAVLAIVALFAAFMLFQFAVEKYLGHVASKDELGFFTWLGAVVFALVYMVSRAMLGGSRVDDFLGRLIDACFGKRRC